MNRLHFMDGLRCIAAVSVVFQHLLEGTAANTVFMVLSPGLFGVVLFFFISGFIIPYSVGAQLNPDKFVINRVFRIFPAYLAILAITLAFGWLGFLGFAGAVSGPDKNALWLVANLLLIAEYVGQPVVVGVVWTLPLEFAWYTVFGLLYALYGRRCALPLTIGYSLLILVLSIVASSAGLAIPTGRLSLVGAASVGYLFYLWQSSALSVATLRTGILVFALATLCSFTITYSFHPHPNVGLANALISWGAALIFFVAVQTVAAVRESRALTNRAICWLGEVSYSMYLIHGLCIAIVWQLTESRLLLVPLSLALTTVASWAVYQGVERSGITLGRSLYNAMKTRNIAILSHLLPASIR